MKKFFNNVVTWMKDPRATIWDLFKKTPRISTPPPLPAPSTLLKNTRFKRMVSWIVNKWKTRGWPLTKKTLVFVYKTTKKVLYHIWSLIKKVAKWCWHHKNWAFKWWYILLPLLLVIMFVLWALIGGLRATPAYWGLITWAIMFGSASLPFLIAYWGYKQNWARWIAIAALGIAALPAILYYGIVGVSNTLYGGSKVPWLYVIGILLGIATLVTLFSFRGKLAGATSAASEVTKKMATALGVAVVLSGIPIFLIYIIGNLMDLEFKDIVTVAEWSIGIIFALEVIIAILDRADLRRARKWLVMLIIVANALNLWRIAYVRDIKFQQAHVVPQTAKQWVMSLENYNPETLRPSPWHDYRPPQPVAVIQWSSDYIELKRSYTVNARLETCTYVWNRRENPLFGTYSAPDYHGVWRMWPSGKDKYVGELITINKRGEETKISMWLAATGSNPL